MPSSGSIGATVQSEPKASVAPWSSSERKAYVVLIRSGPMRFSAQRPSSMAWYGCIDAITPSRPKRPMSSRRRCWACSIRKRRSRGAVGLRDAVEDREQHPVGPLADGVDHDLKPGRVGRADPGAQRILGRGEHAGRRRVVVVRRVEERGGGAERAVHVALHAADPDPVVAPAEPRDACRRRRASRRAGSRARRAP